MTVAQIYIAITVTYFGLKGFACLSEIQLVADCTLRSALVFRVFVYAILCLSGIAIARGGEL